MMRRCATLGASLALGVLGVTSSAVFAPARAHAPSAVIPPDQDVVQVDHQRAILSWDGSTERMIVGMDIVSAAADAALLIPTPSPAEVTELEDDVFDELDDHIAPQVHTQNQWWPDFLQPIPDDEVVAPPIEDRAKVDLDPATATVLEASDADELTDWLDEHDYAVDDDTASALMPYIQQDWYFLALELRTDAHDLSGSLPPVQLSFETNQLIYPVRLNSVADDPFAVSTYVFADHRMERADADAADDLQWAGPVDAEDFTNPSLAEIAGSSGFLTVSSQLFSEPDRIDSDFSFAAAGSDREYHRTHIEVQRRDILGVPAGPVLIFGSLILIGVLGATRSWRTRRRQI